MKVILLSDVKKLGKKGDIVEVSDGYGRNFLLNKNLAVMATKKSMEILDEQNLQHDLEEKQKEADAEDLKKQLAKITLTDVKVDLYRNKVIGTIRVHVNG